MKEPEEKIPVYHSGHEIYFVVDCPSLHIVQIDQLGPRRDSTSSTGLADFEQSPSLCPACGQYMSKARQIPSLCFAPTGSPITSNITLTPPLSLERFASPWPATSPPKPFQYAHIPSGSVSQHSSASFDTMSLMRNPPSPTLPESIESLGIIDGHLYRHWADITPARAATSTPTRPLTPTPTPIPAPVPPVEQKRNGRFQLKWPGSRTKTGDKKAPPKSTYSQESNDSGLPKSMAFTFALTGKALLVWKKDGEGLVRIELETSSHQYINLGDMLPGKPDMGRMVNIRFAVEGSEWIAAIVAHTVANQRRLSLIILHSSGLSERSSVYSLDDQTEARCLAISPDNAFVAVGFGTKVTLLHYAEAEQQWIRVLQLPIPNLASSAAARFQALSFSDDSACLAVSTQKRDALRSEDDDIVFTHVWRCEPGSNSPLTLWPCRMPTDGLGLTTISFHPVLSTGVITGMTITPYPIFLTPRDRFLPPPILSRSSVPDFRIRCSAARRHLVYLLDHRSRLLCADIQAQTARVIADLGALRGALKPQEEHAAMGVVSDDTGRLRVFWRQGNGLHLVEIEVRESMGLGKILKREDVSSRWLDALLGAG